MDAEKTVGERARAPLADDDAMLAWVVALARATPDVYVKTPAGGITAATRLRDDLGIDSIGRVCVFYELADAIGSADDEAVAATWVTVGDVIAYVRASAT